jgi:hypothetical protein
MAKNVETPCQLLHVKFKSSTAICRTVVIVQAKIGGVLLQLWSANNRIMVRPPPITACCMTTVLQIAVPQPVMKVVD